MRANRESDMIAMSTLKPNDRNPRKITSDALKKLAESIERDPQFMELRPIIVDESRMILGGNQRFRACQQLGMKSVPSTWVRTATGLTDEQRKRFIIVDNAPEGMAGEWDMEILAAEWQMPELGDLGFDLDELTSNLPADEDVDAEPQISRAEELAKKWAVQPGQLWELGDHRLFCGDSTSSSDVSKLMGSDVADMMWTDPPYGVSYVGKTKSALTIQNDGADGLDLLLADAFGRASEVLKDGAAIYISHPAGAKSVVFGVAFLAAGWRLHETLVWAKDSMVLGHSDYHYKHEPILFGYKAGGGRRGRGGDGWFGDNSQVSVLEVPRPSRSEEHPTMKPVALVAIMVRNSSAQGQIIYEPFSGSGTTIIACEQLGRKCRAIELSPGYVAVALQRFKDATGKTPTLVDEGSGS
jgi:DNA modification methylase